MRRPPAILRIVAYFFAVGTVMSVVGVVGVMLFILQYSRDLPDHAALKKYEPGIMTRLYASDGQLLAEYAKERRLFVPIEAIPQRLINAFLAAEDKKFYEHNGIDYVGILRAVLNNVENKIIGRGGAQGASTITQQVTKNFLLSSERTIDRKIKEALLSVRIEETFSKDKILELYLNEIYLGIGAYGVGAASLMYFDKSVHELTISESAYLAALPKGPNNYHPYRHRERAIERRNWVIGQMAEAGFITAEAAAQAKADPLTITPRSKGAQIQAADFFAEEVRRIILDRYDEKGLYKGGLSVRTTLDPKLQVILRKAMTKTLIAYDQKKGWRGPITNVETSGDWGQKLAEVPALGDVAPWRLAVVLELSKKEAHIGLQPEKLASGEVVEKRERAILPFKEMRWARWAKGEREGKKVRTPSDILNVGDVVYVEPADDDGTWSLRQVPDIQGGAVAMDPHTGRVLALFGGFSFFEGQFNRATQAQRQPGSSFKPFIYAAALDNGYTPSSVVMDAPIEIESGDEVWKPENYSGRFYGPQTLRIGIEQSRNLMTIRLAQDMGMPLVAEYAKRFGIYDNLPPYLSMSLGAGETTVMRMTGAYAMLANGGKQIRPTLIDRIQDRYGRTIYRHDARQCEACNVTAWEGQDEPTLVDDRQQILDPMTAYQVVSMLEGVVTRGTGHTIDSVGKPLAGKTGTTNDYKDAWFVGFSPDLTMGLYIGYDKPKSMGKLGSGGGIAAAGFRDFMKEALAGKPGIPFRVPPGMHVVRINAKTGLRAGPGESSGILAEAFKPGTNPPDSYSVIGYTAGGEPAAVTPEADRAVRLGTGGLY